jgi:phosphoglycerate-specific signal transduction histidine kinase
MGDLNVEVPVTHLDEFGWLGENFNRMLRKLREKDESLARWNAELEQKVAAATEELAKKNEELARANHRLFEAQRALGNSERLASLGQLASQLAHEIGTPLNSIYGHIQLLAADEIPDEAKKRVAIVEAQVERLTKIIENVLRTLRLPEARRCSSTSSRTRSTRCPTVARSASSPTSANSPRRRRACFPRPPRERRRHSRATRASWSSFACATRA